MLRVSRYASILILLLAQLLVARPASGNESYIQSLTGQLKQNDSCVVTDDKFVNLPLSQWNQLTHLSVTNLVSFELRTDTSIYYYNKPFTCSLNVTIKYFTSRDQVTPTEVSNIDLVVSYDSAKGSTYPHIAQYRFKDAFKVVVVINSITSQEYGANIPAIFRLKSQILVDRRYPFTQSVTGGLTLTKVNLNTDPNLETTGGGNNQVAQRLNISWQPADFPGSEEYDLEWTYIDEESAEGKAILNQYTSSGIVNVPDNIVNKWLHNNCTRVTIKEASYEINLPFQEGHVLFRVRGVSIQPETNLRLTTNWNYRKVGGNTAAHQMEAPYQAERNYQYTASFAEEGKRKEVISYFDGTLKNRQAVTVSNSDLTTKYTGSITVITPTAVVAETIYDELGRPTLNVLPAPTKRDNLNFQNGVNANSESKPFSFKDISITAGGNGICGPGAGTMSTYEGASNYYSPANKFLSPAERLFDKYIPDAGQKPYSLTQYTSDNTGRIRRTWAAGDVFQPNATSKGHPTEYFYGKPSQKELDRLFGSEAGNASHYLKNMVVDPNKQVSVTYLDAQGRTIATALAGDAPQNLEALPSSTKPEAAAELKRRIIGKDDFRRNATDLSLQASATFVAALPGTHTIYYSVNPSAVITRHNNNQEQFCSNCYYEVKVEVRNDCGDLVTSDLSTPFTLNDVTCNPSTVPVEKSFDAQFQTIGEYTITYTLQLSDQQISYYTDHYIQNNSDLFKLQDFFQKQLDELDLIGCYSSCESCKTLGTKEQFRTRVRETLANSENFQGIELPVAAGNPLDTRIDAIWEQLSANCTLNNPCVVTNACATYLEQMKLQVRAGGQYAPYGYDEETGVYTLLEPLVNLIPKLQATETPDLTFTSADGRSLNRKTLSMSDLIKEYINHPEWADEIVKYHVEYCDYEWCKYTTGGVNNENSYNFDRTLRDMVTTGQEAVNRLYFNRSQPLLLLQKDPFFATGGAGASYYSRVANLLTNYTAEHKIYVKNSSNTILAGKNILQYIDWVLYCRPSAEGADVTDMATSWNCTPSTACRSLTREWELYRNFYLQIKSRYVEIVKREKLPACVTCFIGEDPLGDLPNSSCTVPAPPPCASASQFTMTKTNSSTLPFAGECYREMWDQNLVSTTGAVTERVTVRIRRQFSGITGTLTNLPTQTQFYNITFEPGQSVKFIDNGRHVYGTNRRECGDQIDDFSIVEIVCETFPNSICKDHPNRAAYAEKQRVFMEYFDQNRYTGCEKPVNFDPTLAEAQAAALLRERLIFDLDNTNKPNWKEKLMAVKNEFAEFNGITETQIDQIITGIGGVSLQYLNNARSKDLAIVNEVRNKVGQTGPYVSPLSFDAVFKSVLGNTLVEKGFSHYLLEDVYPFDKRPVYENETTGELNTDICNNLNIIKGRYTSSGFSGTFYEYLKQEMGEDFILKPEELAELESRCANSPICRFLNEQALLPGAFTAKMLNPDPLIQQLSFIDYTQYLTLKNNFAIAFSGLPVTHELYQTLYASYFNQHTGFIKSYAQLMAFEQRYQTNPLAALYNTPASPLILPDDLACVREQLKRAYERAGQEYDYYITQERKKFRNNYISTCLSNQATASIKGILREYHYTLYYYDQSGNLVKTIPPEGVRILNDQECELVDEFRNFPAATCDGTGIPTTTDKLATLTSIGNLWNAQTSKSLEMWLYSGGSNESRQVRWVTADKKYLFQAAISDQKLWMELYTLETTGTDLAITLSNQVVADINHITVQAWSHLVAQSTDFTTAEWTVYLDGKKLTLSNPTTEPTYPFAWEIEPGPTVPADDLASLKHVRLYNRSLTDGEVAANFRNSCLSPVGALGGTPMDLWARFNIPAPGSETTTGTGSTNEFVSRFIVPKHGLPTNYEYNSFAKVIRQQTPDGGITAFWYDKLGRILASQNGEQKLPTNSSEQTNRYTFTKYDALDRIREVGEKIAAIDITTVDLWNQQQVSNWYTQGIDRSLTQTVYDVPPSIQPASAIFENIRHRVTAITFKETRDAQKFNATYYSYDISGNAKTVYQHIGELLVLDNNTGIKKLEYDFDLISGNLNMLSYQKGKGDQFLYKYEYDANNRIKVASTSRDGLIWNQESRYSYYLHGPLARAELGSKNVQGIDYAYTLMGWLKAINGNDLIPGEDIGGDAVSNSLSNKFNRDELAFTLGYFNGDYSPIGSSANAVSRKYVPEYTPLTPYIGTGADLYNGNISNSTVHIASEVLGAAKGYTYRYDQLNRLLTVQQHAELPTTPGSTWNNLSGTDAYKEKITYDANGNILTFQRNTAGASLMDKLTYHYNKDVNGNLLNNKLRHVLDEVTAGAFDVDIDAQSVDNYLYDKIGNLISDNAEGLNTIKWTPYGKISSIQKAINSIEYQYDGAGNRVWKRSSNGQKSTIYVRDPQGNVLSVYEFDEQAGSGGILKWVEQYLYGSQRLGIWSPNITVTNSWQSPGLGGESIIEGQRTYELSNHLGNVLATINDKKVAVDEDADGINDYFKSELLSVTDYYAFGMQMPGRNWSLGNYRFGFNGKENDDEVKGGDGLQQDYGMRVYDNRLGRFLSKDPLSFAFPWWTPYQFAGNMPIRYIDLDGLEPAEPGSNNGEIRKATYTYGEKNGFDGDWYWDGKEWSPIMQAVVVTPEQNESKINWKEKVMDAWGTVSAYGIGFFNAWASNNLMGWQRGTPEMFGKYADAARAGMFGGDVAALTTSTLEMAGGVGAHVGGGVLDAGGVTLPAGVAAHEIGTLAIGHGALTFSTAWRNLMNSYDQAASANDGNNSFGDAPRRQLGEASWSSDEVSKAAKALNDGKTEITMSNKSQVEELFFRLFQGKGYKNTTGSTGKMVRTDKYIYPNGKRGTYHWDLNDTQHGGVPHLQIHDFDGNVIRLFFKN